MPNDVDAPAFFSFSSAIAKLLRIAAPQSVRLLIVSSLFVLWAVPSTRRPCTQSPMNRTLRPAKSVCRTASSSLRSTCSVRTTFLTETPRQRQPSCHKHDDSEFLYHPSGNPNVSSSFRKTLATTHSCILHGPFLASDLYLGRCARLHEWYRRFPENEPLLRLQPHVKL
jgi:hypothetical protein